ncbi:MAG: hypothetical protein NXH80_16485 [Rhodobacteraceae bacterium]|nr:hypothetical protein [Paracoccaceae bacterium]
MRKFNVLFFCRELHEWPQRPLQGGIEVLASAAFFLLRVRAAKKPNSQVGLGAVANCATVERLVCA